MAFVGSTESPDLQLSFPLTCSDIPLHSTWIKGQTVSVQSVDGTPEQGAHKLWRQQFFGSLFHVAV